MKLRTYQLEAIEAVHQARARGVKRCAVVLPTGMGKTVILTSLIAQRPERALVLVHRDELVKQTVKQIETWAPDRSIGVVKAERNELHRDVVVASVQTLGRRNRLAMVPAGHFGLVIVDECHHAAADGYRRILDHTDTFTVGFTATLVRGDARGLGDVFEEVVYRKDILYGILNGYLADIKGQHVTVDGMDLDAVARSRGDYQDGDLGRAMISAGAGPIVAAAYREHATGRQAIGFAPSVASTEYFAEAFSEAGIASEFVTGGTSVEDRALTYKRVLTGDTQVLWNCAVLTEGFDLPQLSCAIMARPTGLPGLYTQMVGRVLRPWPGKLDALCLDVVGVSRRHRLATIADLTETSPSPLPGETLAEAVARMERETEDVEQHGTLTGRLLAKAVDLFANSHSAWLRTAGGTMFVPTRYGMIFLAPDFRDGAEPETWLIGKTATQWKRTAAPRDRVKLGESLKLTRMMVGWGWLRDGMPLDLAMSVAEDIAEAVDSSVSSRTSSWRKRQAPPSEAQVGILERAGLEVPATKNEAANMISVYAASMILDTKK